MKRYMWEQISLVPGIPNVLVSNAQWEEWEGCLTLVKYQYLQSEQRRRHQWIKWKKYSKKYKTQEIDIETKRKERVSEKSGQWCQML